MFSTKRTERLVPFKDDVGRPRWMLSGLICKLIFGTLAEIICAAGDAPATALFVLMGTLEHSTQPKLLANTAKHFAFTSCGEANLYGMVDDQIAVVEGELLKRNTLTS